MRNHGYAALSGVAMLFLSWGAFSIATPGQTAAPPAAPAAPAPPAASRVPAPPTKPAAPAAWDEEDQCDALAMTDGLSGGEQEKIESELESDLAGLEADVEQEAVMMEPQILAKVQNLSKEIENKSPEWAARAAEAQERAAEILAQAPMEFSLEGESGWLGLEIAEVNAEKAKELKLSAVRGVVVVGVLPDGPAAKAGLKENDAITGYDGQTVEGTVQFRRLVRETPPGRRVTLEVMRDGQPQKLTIEVGDRAAQLEKHMWIGGEETLHEMHPHTFAFSMPDVRELGPLPEVFDFHTPLLGISAEDLNRQLGEYFGAPEGEGILVREVRAGTPAEKAGLKAGDVITKVEGKPVRTLRDLRHQLREKSDQKPVSLTVLRRGSELTIPVTIEKPRPIETPPAFNRAQL